MQELFVVMGWAFFAGFCFGACIFYFKGMSAGIERATAQIRYQQEMDAYNNYINSLRG